MRLFLNADDFGFSKGVNLGILEAFLGGTLSSTSLMVNMPGFNHAIDLMKQYPILNVGIHLVTSVEYSISKGLKTLTDEHDHFYHDFERIKNCDVEELKVEYEAQLQKFLATGFKPTHIDFHWCYFDNQIEAAIYLSKKYDIPLRTENKEMEALFEKHHIKHNINMQPEESFFKMDGSQSPELLISLLQKCLDEKLEECGIIFHPAYVDQTLYDLSSYHYQRAKELYSLTHPKVIQFIKEANFQLVSYKDL